MKKRRPPKGKPKVHRPTRPKKKKVVTAGEWLKTPEGQKHAEEIQKRLQELTRPWTDAGEYIQKLAHASLTDLTALQEFAEPRWEDQIPRWEDHVNRITEPLRKETLQRINAAIPTEFGPPPEKKRQREKIDDPEVLQANAQLLRHVMKDWRPTKFASEVHSNLSTLRTILSALPISPAVIEHLCEWEWPAGSGNKPLEKLRLR